MAGYCMPPDTEKADVILVMSNGGFGGVQEKILRELEQKNA